MATVNFGFWTLRNYIKIVSGCILLGLLLGLALSRRSPPKDNSPSMVEPSSIISVTAHSDRELGGDGGGTFFIVRVSPLPRSAEVLIRAQFVESVFDGSELSFLDHHDHVVVTLLPSRSMRSEVIPQSYENLVGARLVELEFLEGPYPIDGPKELP